MYIEYQSIKLSIYLCSQDYSQQNITFKDQSKVQWELQVSDNAFRKWIENVLFQLRITLYKWKLPMLLSLDLHKNKLFPWNFNMSPISALNVTCSSLILVILVKFSKIILEQHIYREGSHDEEKLTDENKTDCCNLLVYFLDHLLVMTLCYRSPYIPLKMLHNMY